MERNYLSNSLNDHYGGSNNHLEKKKVKDLWKWNNNKSYGDEDTNYLAGFSWPPRSYTCSFCKREFKSAQALGGHMNVHRRDRARLRQSSPPCDTAFGKYPSINLNAYPILKPNATSVASTSIVSSPISCVSPCFFNRTYGHSSPKRMPRMNGAKTASGYENNCLFLKKSSTEATGRLDLDIGMFRGYGHEDLDLELRLGYS